MDLGIKGRQAIVCGSSKGLGKACALALVKEGVNVVVSARTEADLLATADELRAVGPGDVRAITADVTTEEGREALFAACPEPDILVNNAGATRRGSAETITAEDWNFVLNLNVTAAYTLCRAFARDRIKDSKKGKIINLASVMSETIREDNAPYAASKGAIRQLTKALAVDWAKYRINVNAIGPGFIQTDLTRPLWEDESFDKWLKWKTPQARWGKPEDLGNAAVYLASPASDFVTGHILYVDGGLLSTFGPSSW